MTGVQRYILEWTMTGQRGTLDVPVGQYATSRRSPLLAEIMGLVREGLLMPQDRPDGILAFDITPAGAAAIGITLQ